MPFVDLFRSIWCFVVRACEFFLACFPERLTTTLTVLEIVYYCIAIVYFLLEIVVLVLSLY